mgnify:CR=1 FL=1
MSVVIVTGSAGYIGGQTMLALKDAGHEVYGIDRREPPKHLRGVPNGFLYQDFASDVALSWIIQKQPNAIIHCAGTSLVGPSVKNPSEYYNNNVAKTLKLLDIVKQSMPRCRLVFSSSAATYGEPIMNPIHEVDPKEPVSPYGESKLMIDMMLESYHRAYGTDYVSFRYFNACGADPQGRHGQEPGATHLIAKFLEAARDDGQFRIYGDDYPTTDGTCIRDYVDVRQLAKAHFDSVCGYLKEAGIPFKLNHRLVRGLDYYNRTVYEWVTNRLGAQGTIAGGGRYDYLIERLGGDKTPACGFGIGMERIILLLEDMGVVLQNEPNIYLVNLGDAAEKYALKLSETLRTQGLKVVLNSGGSSFKSQMKRADKSGAAFAVILGDDEMKEGVAQVKSLRVENVQSKMPLDELALFLLKQTS